MASLIGEYRKGVAMKIHMRLVLPPMPAPPPPKPLQTIFQVEMQAEELIKTAQQQKSRLKKLYAARNKPGDLDEDSDSERREQDHRSKRNAVDFIA